MPSSDTSSNPPIHATTASVGDSPLPPLPSTEVALTRHLAVGSLIGLIVLCIAWELWLAPLRPGGSWLVLKALPLCLPLAGLLKRRLYTYRWVSLLVWLYFIEGVVRAYSDRPPSSYWAGVEILLCLALFAACSLHVRWRFKNAAHTQASTSP